ncbi:MAG: four helix bundle protein, partial [bacterium]|nr:four helix bundle protein [bacterium]
MPKNEITRPIIGQLVACGTAVGANYCEADNAESKKDFKHKIGICKKESREFMHFLRMSAIAAAEMKDRARKLWQEAKELNL